MLVQHLAYCAIVVARQNWRINGPMPTPLASVGPTLYTSPMTGRPKLLALRKRIADDDLEDDIFEAVAEGTAIGNLCTMFKITSRKMFYDWKGKDGPRHDKYTAARLIAAEAHAERAGEILDELVEDKSFLTGPDVAAATSRSKYQQWLASIKNPADFGTNQAPAVVLNFGELHFESLRNSRPGKVVINPATAPERIERIVEADFEEVAVGNDGEDEAHAGHTIDPISPPTATPLSELADLL